MNDAYEEKKKDYMKTKFKEFEEKLTGRSRDPSEVIPLKCGECGFSWQYHGLLENGQITGLQITSTMRFDRNHC